MRKEEFLKLQKSSHSWGHVQRLVSFRRFRREADDITPTSPQELQRIADQEYEAKGDPFLFELLMEPRYVVRGQA